MQKQTSTVNEKTTLEIPYVECPPFTNRHEAEQFELGFFKENPKCQQFIRVCSPNEYPPEKYNRFGPDNQLFALVVEVFPGLVQSLTMGLSKDLKPNEIGPWIAENQVFADWVKTIRSKGRLAAFCQPGANPSTVNNRPIIDMQIPYIECPSFNNSLEAHEFDEKYFLANPQAQHFLRLISPGELQPGEYADVVRSPEDQLFGLIIDVCPGLVARQMVALPKKYDPAGVAAWCSQEPDTAKRIKDARQIAFKASSRDREKYVRMAKREADLMRS